VAQLHDIYDDDNEVIKRDIIINVRRYSYSVTVILVIL
jgi:hypothetical protein